MSLCFLQAVAKANLPEGGITQQEFFNHLLAHFQGVRHPQDSISSIGDTLASIEPWVGSLREVALASDYEPLEDISDYEGIFTLCIKGQTDSFKSALQALRGQSSVPDPLQPAACLAAQKQHHEILRCCLDKGAIFDRYLTRAAQMGAHTPAMLELLYAENWADIRCSPDAVQRQILHFGEDSFEAKWLREHAGKGALAKKPESSSESTKNKDGNGQSPKPEGVGHGKGQGRNSGKGTGSRDPKQGPTPEQIQKWFGDVPW